MSYSNSGYGDGVSIPFEKIEAMWPSPPKTPQYFLTEQTATPKSEDGVTHSTIPKNNREKKIKLTKRAATKSSMDERHRTKVQAAVGNGLFLCDAQSEFNGAFCRCQYQSQKALDAHKKRGKHIFGS